MSTSDIRWINSSRMGSPAVLEPFINVLREMDTVLQVYSQAVRVMEGIAEAEAWVRTVVESLSARQLAGIGFQEAVSEIIGDYLSDSAHILFHSNLRRVIDEYGIAPFLDDALARAKTTRDPVPTQFPLPYSAAWFRTAANRLGSSTLRGLEQPPLESGFGGWQAEVIDAFYDRGDFQRPSYPAESQVGALLITVQATDPKDLFDRYAALVRLFSKKPAEMVLPQFVQFARDMVGSVDLTGLGLMSTTRALRPQLTTESWSTSPDFVRVSSRDLIPLIGDILLDFQVAADLFGADPPTSKALEGFANSLSAFAEHYGRLYSEALSALNSVVALLAQPNTSRLWIPVDFGGSDRVVEEILAAEATRKDLQRVVNPGLAVSGYQRNDFITYEQAVAEQALDASFRFKPAENLLVAGVVIVVNQGPLGTLIADALAPKQADCDESDGLAGPATVENIFPEASFDAPAGDPYPSSDRGGSLRQPEPRGGSLDPTDRERTGWVERPLSEERPVGPTAPQQGGIGVRSRTPHPSVFPSRGAVTLQVVRPGTARSAVLRRMDGEVATEYTAVALGAETRGANVVPSGSRLTSPVSRPTPSLSNIPWAGAGGRAPVGEAPSAAEQAPQSVMPLRSGTLEWSEHSVAMTPIVAVVTPGGASFSSVELDSMVVAQGYAGGGALLEDLTPDKAPWWVDLEIAWKYYTAGSSITRRSVVRTQVTEVAGAPGSTVFRCVPRLPSAPLIDSNTLEGVAWAGVAMGFASEVPSRPFSGSAIDFADARAPGVTFESVASWRRALTEDLEEGFAPTLQATSLGVIVDSDTAQVGLRERVRLTQKSGPGPAGLLYNAATYPTLPAWQGVHAEYPLPSSELISADEIATGGTFVPQPVSATRDAYRRAEQPAKFPYYALSDQRVSDPISSERYLSARLPRAGSDSRVLTAHVPRQVRVGLGTVSSAPVEIPTGAAQRAILLLDPATGRWEEQENAADPAALAGGQVIATPAFVADHAGKPWAVSLGWDSSTGEPPAAQLLPATRRVARSTAWFGGQNLGDPAVSDEFLSVPGFPINARYGACPSGEATFSTSGDFDGETAWIDLPAIVGTSRRTQKGWRMMLTLVPLAPWTGRDSTWTLAESASHVLALRSAGSCYLDVFEKDLVSGDLVLRATALLPDPIEGRRYRVTLEVDPDAPLLQAYWAEANSDSDAAPTYVTRATAAASVGPSDPYPYLRALDGYPLPGGTIRVGRPVPPMKLEARLDSPYVDDVTVYISGAPTQQTWAIGTLPLGLLSVEADRIAPSMLIVGP